MRPFSRYARACAFALTLLGVGGCGAGGVTEPEADLPHAKLLRIYATPELDGVVWSDGTVDTDGGNLVTGDLDGVTNGLAARQFFSFDLTKIPAGATIGFGEVQFFQVKRVGSPYDTHDAILTEVMDYGLSLDAADYDAPSLLELVRFRSASQTIGFGGNTSFVTPPLLAALEAGRPTLQFRCRFYPHDSDLDGVSDHVVVIDAEMSVSGAPAPPTLSVAYYPAAKP